eukprot:6244850-Amphidinium_carterae.1
MKMNKVSFQGRFLFLTECKFQQVGRDLNAVPPVSILHGNLCPYSACVAVCDVRQHSGTSTSHSDGAE